MPATTQAVIHDRFQTRNAELIAQAQAQADAVRQPAQRRPWQLPAPLKALGDDPMPAFDRTDIGANYATAVASATAPGTVGDTVSLKLQSDWLAALERSFRARHAPTPRLLAMAAARRRGHGNPQGSLAAIARYAQTAIAAGGVG